MLPWSEMVLRVFLACVCVLFFIFFFIVLFYYYVFEWHSKSFQRGQKMTAETGYLSGRISNSNRTPLIGYIPYFRLHLQEEERINVDTNARDPGKKFGTKVYKY